MTGEIELLELRLPMHIVRHELLPDSCCPGRWRGGCGADLEMEIRDPECVATRTGGGILYTPASRLQGGARVDADERLNRVWIRRASGEREEFPLHSLRRLSAGDRVYGKVSGGGGVGPSLGTRPEGGRGGRHERPGYRGEGERRVWGRVHGRRRPASHRRGANGATPTRPSLSLFLFCNEHRFRTRHRPASRVQAVDAVLGSTRRTPRPSRSARLSWVREPSPDGYGQSVWTRTEADSRCRGSCPAASPSTWIGTRRSEDNRTRRT